MGANRTSLSLFNHRLDRVAFTAYFLGAVVPLAAVVAVANLGVFALGDGRGVHRAAFLVSLAVLSLGSFLCLRRITRESLRRMDSDRERIMGLFNASTALTGAQDSSAAARVVTRYAIKLASGREAFLLLQGLEARAPEVLGDGDSLAAMSGDLREAILEIGRTVMAESRPVLCRPAGEAGGDSQWPGPSTVMVPLVGEGRAIGALVVLHQDRNGQFETHQVDALWTLAGLASAALMNADLRHAQRNFFAHVLELLGTGLDHHLGYHAGHGQRVAEFANRIAHEMAFRQDDLQRLHFAARLHDIGFLKIDREHHGTPEAKTRHPELGAEMLSRIRLWEDCAPIVRHHHERYDGTGFPDGLAGNDIPLESRIIFVCEAFDAQTSHTSYKQPCSVEDALRELEDNAGTQFDPEVVRTFVQLVKQGAFELDEVAAPTSVG